MVSESGILVSHVMLYLGENRVIDASIKNSPDSVVVRDMEEVWDLGRKHVATRRYVENFARLTHFENSNGNWRDVEDVETLKTILSSNEEK